MLIYFMHYYWQEEDLNDFLLLIDMDDFIQTIKATCDYVKLKAAENYEDFF